MMFKINLSQFDQYLMSFPVSQNITGIKRFFLEFLFFGIKEARACLFAALFFSAVLLIPRHGISMIPRYDVLLLFALIVQAMMLWSKIESIDELKVIVLFHLLGFALELFKTSQGIKSWSYPDFAYSKVFNVPLFSGFMYSSVSSYIIQAWRLLKLRIVHHPPYYLSAIMAALIYLNFFTSHYIGDYRNYLAACVLGLYARTQVIFYPLDKERRMPLLLGFILTGFFIWLAENISTFLGIWSYPHQLSAWSAVHISKWSSWSLLIIMSFTVITQLKHIKATIYIPE